MRVLYNEKSTESKELASTTAETLDTQFAAERLIIVVIPVPRAEDQHGVWMELPINVSRTNEEKVKSLVPRIKETMGIDPLVTGQDANGNETVENGNETAENGEPVKEGRCSVMVDVPKRFLEEAAKAINQRFEGTDARVFDNGEGPRISINCGDTFSIAESFSINCSGLPTGTFLEPVNGEVLGLYPIF